MTTENPTESPEGRNPNGEFGEGNYKAARQHQKSAHDFVENEGEKIEKKAREAADALDGEEGEELRHAEEDARGRARP